MSNLSKSAEQYGFPSRTKMLEDFKEYLMGTLAPSSAQSYSTAMTQALDKMENLTLEDLKTFRHTLSVSRSIVTGSAWNYLVKFVNEAGIANSLPSIQKTTSPHIATTGNPTSGKTMEKHPIGMEICILAEIQREIFHQAGNVMLTTKEKKVLNKMVSIRIGDMEWVFKSPENKGKPHLMALLKIVQWGYKGHKNPVESDFLLVASPGDSMPMTTKQVQEIITAEGLNIQKLCSGYFLDAKVCTTIEGVDLRLSSWQEEQMTRKGLLKPRFVIDLDQELPANVAELPAMIPERRYVDPVAEDAEFMAPFWKAHPEFKVFPLPMPKEHWKKLHEERQARMTPEERKHDELSRLLERSSIKRDTVNREVWKEQEAELAARKARKELEKTLLPRRQGRQTEAEKKAWADAVAALPVVAVPEKKSIPLQKELDEMTARIVQLQKELAEVGYKEPELERSPEEMELIKAMAAESLAAEAAQLRLEEEMLAAEEAKTAAEAAAVTAPSVLGTQDEQPAIAPTDQKSSIGGTYPEVTRTSLESTKPEEPESFGPAALDEW